MPAKSELLQFRVGESNYNYIIFDPLSKEALVIDPLEARAVMSEIKRLGIQVRMVINTHGHFDHTAGNEGVIRETGARLGAGEHEEIAGVSEPLAEGQKLRLNGMEVRILFTPGHTAGHISLVIDDRWLMVGDTLFVGGCGNCNFGGNVEALFESLQKLKALPDHLRVCCGHEYALKNLSFCAKFEPENEALAAMKKRAAELISKGEVLTTTLGEEKRYNVFLRAQEPALQAEMRRIYPELAHGATDARIFFRKLRAERNHF